MSSSCASLMIVWERLEANPRVGAKRDDDEAETAFHKDELAWRTEASIAKPYLAKGRSKARRRADPAIGATAVAAVGALRTEQRLNAADAAPLVATRCAVTALTATPGHKGVARCQG